ncbi:bifunctional N(6)-L-threonylcarbamoyladenine synthase/serine/threonine protein kinase [Candidatus Woesearchaeota archaeon]|nr:MAG: bifunctional N(6)-L-threonylcarbamoyladenine synthase/serine/threonine protein kinase [Candidatus Woesearchaeota archaeon]
MIVLGIESTAHTFGVSVIREKQVLSNERKAFTTQEGGMIPAKVAQHHVQWCDTVVKNALEKAGVTMKDIDLVAFSQSPGLGNCLRIGAVAARSLALIYDKPIIGVNHCVAHLEVGKMQTDVKDPVLLYASGANTQVIALEGGKYRVFGETLDTGIGNFLDTLARNMKLGFPGGPKIEALATKGKNLIELPYSVKGMDVSFSGILTNLTRMFEKNQASKEDIAFSAQEYAFAALVEVSERALAHTGKKELLLGGGVACNKRLQEMCRSMCEARGAKCYVLENQFNVDNAAMIAWLGLLEFRAGKRQKIEETAIDPYLRTDEVEVSW